MPLPLKKGEAAALRLVVDAVTDAVRAAEPIGASGGVIYAALMAYCCSKSQFDSLMGAMVRLNKLRQDGDLYHLPTPVRS